MGGAGFRGKSRIEAETEMVIKGIVIGKLAVSGFAVGRDSGCFLARVFREIEGSDDYVDIALAEIGELLYEFRVIGASERGRELGFEFREISACEIFAEGQLCSGILIFQEVQIGIVDWLCGGGAPIRKFVMALLQSHATLRTARRMLAGGLFCEVVGAVLRRQVQWNADYDTCETNELGEPVHSSS